MSDMIEQLLSPGVSLWLQDACPTYLHALSAGPSTPPDTKHLAVDDSSLACSFGDYGNHWFLLNKPIKPDLFKSPVWENDVEGTTCMDIDQESSVTFPVAFLNQLQAFNLHASWNVVTSNLKILCDTHRKFTRPITTPFLVNKLDQKLLKFRHSLFHSGAWFCSTLDDDLNIVSDSKGQLNAYVDDTLYAPISEINLCLIAHLVTSYTQVHIGMLLLALRAGHGLQTARQFDFTMKWFARTSEYRHCRHTTMKTKCWFCRKGTTIYATPW